MWVIIVGSFSVETLSNQTLPIIMKKTALIHYISDANHNQFFPVGVEHLLRRGCLKQWTDSGSGTVRALSG